jgi:hypothetical protein
MEKKARPQLKEPVEHKVGLQIRVLYRDSTGKISDVTQNDEVDRGLTDLQKRSTSASDSLSRVRELLQLLALAAENRKHVDAALVQRVLEEVRFDLEDSGELGNYVHYTEKLFEGAMALPRISGIRPEVFQTQPSYSLH